jgi:RND family efflux transporter MFP subunit
MTRHPRRHRRPAGLFLGFVLLLPALPGCGSGQAEDEEPAEAETPTNVRTLVVQQSSLSEYLGISGPLHPVQGTDVSSEETGVVDSIERDKGREVRAGEPLVRLERELLAAEMRAAEASAKLAEYDEERTRELFEANQVSRQEMLQVEATAAQARARADIARERWSRAEVKAPFDGVVADRYVEAGQMVAAGTPVARVVDPYVLELSGAISEREVAWVSPDAPATVTVAGRAGALPGRVHWVSLEADPATGKFQVEVRVENRDLVLRPGVVARAQVLKEQHDGVIVVPRDAIVMRGHTAVAFVVDGDRARRREITVGPDQGLMTAIESGLEPGDRLVVRGQRELRDGALVAVREEASSLDGSTAGDPVEVRAAEAFEPVRIVEGGEAESTP